MDDVVCLDKVRRERAVPACFKDMVADMVERGMMPAEALSSLGELWERRRQHGMLREEAQWSAIKTRECLAREGYGDGDGRSAVAELREHMRLIEIEGEAAAIARVDRIMAAIAELVPPRNLAAIRKIIER